MSSSSCQNIVLCGFMSSGKTTIGKPLAKRLGYQFTDTDELLVSTNQMSIPEMFAIGGEAYFRDKEYEIACKAASMKHTVISTGGGMMTYERNAQILAQTGIVIYIQTDFDTCYSRLCRNPDRPLVKNNTREQLEARYLARIPSYKKYAAYTLVNPTSIDAAIDEIVNFLNA